MKHNINNMQQLAQILLKIIAWVLSSTTEWIANKPVK